MTWLDRKGEHSLCLLLGFFLSILMLLRKFIFAVCIFSKKRRRFFIFVAAFVSENV
jgi:hypothetical protein